VGWEQARTAAARRNGYPADFDLDAYFLHDLPNGIRQQMLGHDVPQSGGPFGDRCAFDGSGSGPSSRPGNPTVTR